ncbi:MAG TPA: amino acid permease [Gaiellaceae bacterium]|jgi:amino acid transporter
MSSVAPESHVDDDARTLHKLGYAQVLYREMGGFSNFAISFTIISILAGCLTSYFIAFNDGGPVAVTWGWLIVGFFVVLVALGMAEVASSMPTAGAIYYWSSKLGSPAWGWFTGWFNLIGQIGVTAAISYGAAIFWTALMNLWFPSVGTDTHTIFITFSAIMAAQLLLNLNGVRLLAWLNSISAWWHMVGVVVIVLVLAIVPDHHQSFSFVFTKTLNASGFSGHNFSTPVFWFVFGIGLLMAQYTYTGYDASAHMSEETRQASRSAAVGVVMSVVMSVIFGFILLVAVTFAVPDVKGTLGAGAFDVTYIWQTSLGTRWAEFLLFIVCCAQFYCGTASVTAASRMMFAFSRDGAVPGGRKLFRKVSPRNRVPIYSVMAIAILSWALMLPTLANGAIGYLVGTSIAVIGLYIAYGVPIFLRWRAGDAFQPGAWSLGKHYKWINPIAVGWIVLIVILFLMPSVPQGIPWHSDFNWNLVNYAPITVGGVLVLVGAWWLVSARKWFKGPVVEGNEEELTRIEAGMATPGTAQPASM